jgi:hypothetical protein
LRPLEGPVDEVEEVQHSDPDDPGQDMDPARERAQNFHGSLLVVWNAPGIASPAAEA